MDALWIVAFPQCQEAAERDQKNRGPAEQCGRTQVGSTFRPGVEVYLLTTPQFASAELISMALVLNRLFSRPADYERTCGPGNQIRVFSRTLTSAGADMIWQPNLV
jgi:hypothetical protein